MSESDQIAQHTFAPWKVAGESRVVASDAKWQEPVKWDKAWGKAAATANRMNAVHFPGMLPSRPRVLVDVDTFEGWQGPMVDAKGEELGNYENDGPLTMSDVRRRLFDLIDATPNLDWLVRTSHPENIAGMMPPWAYHACETGDCPHDSVQVCEPISRRQYRDNLWLGCVCENQATADERIPHLLKVPAAVRVLWCRPTGPIDLRPKAPDSYALLGKYYGTGTFDPSGMSPAADRVLNCFPKIHWVVVEGGSEPLHPDWVRSLRDQCQAAGVPFFFAGWGEWCPSGQAGSSAGGDIKMVDLSLRGEVMTGAPGVACDQWAACYQVGKKAAGRLLDGREWNESPTVQPTV